MICSPMIFPSAWKRQPRFSGVCGILRPMAGRLVPRVVVEWLVPQRADTPSAIREVAGLWTSEGRHVTTGAAFVDRVFAHWVAPTRRTKTPHVSRKHEQHHRRGIIGPLESVDYAVYPGAIRCTCVRHPRAQRSVKSALSRPLEWGVIIGS